MLASLEGGSKIYEVDISEISCGVIGVSPCRELSKECVLHKQQKRVGQADDESVE